MKKGFIIASSIGAMILMIGIVVWMPVSAQSATYNASGHAFSDMPNASDQTVTTTNNYGGRGLGNIEMSGIGYQVQLSSNGQFSGYGWNDIGGYVEFNGVSVSASCLADPNQVCNVTGDAVFIAARNADATVSGGWDGVVRTNGTWVSPVKLGKQINGVRTMSGFAWGGDVVGWVDFSGVKISLPDACPDTKFVMTGSPQNGHPDPKTTGVQDTLPTGYSVQTVDGVKMCGIFDCTDPTATNYNEQATVDDGSCQYDPRCPDGTPPPNGDLSQCPVCSLDSDNYNPITKTCQACHPGVTGYNATTGLCSTNPPPGDPLCPDGSIMPSNGVCPGGEVDQCRNLDGFQGTVSSPYTQVIQAGVKNCYIIGCTDPYANNYNSAATMQDNPSSCKYDPGVETCKQRGDCPNVPTAPKKPIYIET